MAWMVLHWSRGVEPTPPVRDGAGPGAGGPQQPLQDHIQEEDPLQGIGRRFHFASGL